MSTRRAFKEGLLGKKLGMTQVFTKDGESVPVTAVQLGPCYVLDVKKEETDGYEAVKLGFEPRSFKSLNKAEAGVFKAAGSGAFQHIKEMRCSAQALGWDSPGKELKVSDVFNSGDLVDVSGWSIGRGFAGVVRRFHIGGQPSTRGTHEFRRHIGAIGCRKFPGRVHKNKRMPGHMGNELVTVQNLTVVGIDTETNVMLVKGGIPGSGGGLVIVRKAVKGPSESKAA